MAAYWNHNSAYHPWITNIAAAHRNEDLLDVGCGDGLLLQRLAPIMHTAIGIEVDETAATRARRRLSELVNVSVVSEDFMCYRSERQFGLITFVASVHHLPLSAALTRAADMLAPGGDLAVVGVAANRSAIDWVHAGVRVPVVRTSSWLHRESYPENVPVADPMESLAQIRAAARKLLPGARIRRGLYYRYLLRWTKPSRGA